MPYKLSFKQILFEMSSKYTSHSPYKQTSTQDIKRGLERIKQTQLEVLRELRKEQFNPINTFPSNQTDSFEARNGNKIESPQIDVLLKERIRQLQEQVQVYMVKERNLRQENLKMSEKIRSNEQKISVLEILVRRLQNSDNDNLVKAEQALKNAIESEKKYISLKVQFQKLCKQKECIHTDFRKLQSKQLDYLIQTQDQIYGHLAKDLTSLNQAHQKLFQLTSKYSKKLQGKTQLQHQFERYLSKILISLGHGQETYPHPQNQQTQQNYLSGSFQEDIKIIQEELNKGEKFQKQNIVDLQNQINRLSQVNKKIKSELEENEEQTQILRSRVRAQARQIQECKLAKRVLEQEYQDYKKRIKQKLKSKQIQEQKIELMERQMSSSTRQRQSLKKQYEERIKNLEEKVRQKNEEVEKMRNSNKKFEGVIERYKKQAQSVEARRKNEEQQHEFELAKINTQIKQISSLNMKEQREWRQMIESIKKLQEERANLLSNERQIGHKWRQSQNSKEIEVSRLNTIINDMQSVIESLRKENSQINYERSQLIRLRKNVEEKNVINRYDKVVDELWQLKEAEYSEVNKTMGDLVSGVMRPGIRKQQYYLRRQW